MPFGHIVISPIVLFVLKMKRQLGAEQINFGLVFDSSNNCMEKD